MNTYIIYRKGAEPIEVQGGSISMDTPVLSIYLTDTPDTQNLIAEFLISEIQGWRIKSDQAASA